MIPVHPKSLLSEHEVGVTRRSHERLDLADTNITLGKGAG
jgi:hypothetical protein